MQYSEKDLANLIKSVEAEFMADLAKAEETLAKSETAAPAPAATETATTEQKTETLAKSEKEKDHEEYDAKDLEEMHKMYESMSKGEIKAHHDAVVKVMGKCGEMSMGKSETQAETKVEVKAEATPNPEIELLKSETASLKSENESLKKSLDALVEGLNKFVKKSAPQAKAITEVAALAKSEGNAEVVSMSKGEVTALLQKKCADPSLKKSDRDAINAFYLENAGIETISHLLK